MIDILLVLMIAFMLIIPRKQVGLNSQLPQPAPADAPAEPDPATVVLMVRGGGRVEVNQQPVPLEDLQKKLVSIFGLRRDALVFVDGEKNLEYRDVALVIDLARGAGVERVGLMPGHGRSQ